MKTTRFQLTLFEDEAHPGKEPAKPIVKARLAPTPDQLREAAADYTYRKLSMMPEAERPINRIQQYPVGALGNYELLSLLLPGQAPTVDAENMLGRLGGLQGIYDASLEDIAAQPGIGMATAAKIKAALELGRRMYTQPPEDRMQIRSPADAANVLAPLIGSAPTENLVTMLLDTRNRIIAVETITTGSLNAASVRINEVFRPAIRRLAAAIIVAHNHPSGDPTPSPEDVQITRMMVEAGSLLNLDILDHMIICTHRWVSMKERGLGFR